MCTWPSEREAIREILEDFLEEAAWGKDTEPASLTTCSTMVMEVRGCSVPSTTASHVFLISLSRLFSATPEETGGGGVSGSSLPPYDLPKPLERACSLSPGACMDDRIPSGKETWPGCHPCHLSTSSKGASRERKTPEFPCPMLWPRPIPVGPAPGSEGDGVKGWKEGRKRRQKETGDKEKSNRNRHSEAELEEEIANS